MPNGPHKITGLPFDPSKCTSTHSIEGKMKVPICFSIWITFYIYTSRRSNNKLFISDTEILTLLKTSANPKSGKKKKKAAEKAVASETAKAASDDAPPKLTPAAAANES